MLPALWVSKTGLSAQDMNLTTISNNLANVATTGFKRDRAEFEDLLYQIRRQPGGQSSQDSELPSGLQLGTGVRVVGTQKIFTAGSLQTTEQPLDLAVNGRGFFQILQPDGTVSYTRDGSFHLNSDGQIVTSQGFALEPAIVLPNEVRTFTVGEDGTVSVTTAGNPQPQIIGNIRWLTSSTRQASKPSATTCSWKPVPAVRRRSATLASTVWAPPCRTPWKTPTSAWWRSWST